jgi:hypothetical protein
MALEKHCEPSTIFLCVHLILLYTGYNKVPTVYIHPLVYCQKIKKSYKGRILFSSEIAYRACDIVPLRPAMAAT